MEFLRNHFGKLRWLKSGIRVLGLLFFGAAVTILSLRLGNDLASLNIRKWHWLSIYTSIAIISTMMMLIAMSFGWTRAIRFGGGNLDFASGFMIYYRTNILRYLPGGIWNFPGRAYYAHQVGISLRTFKYGTFFEFYFLLLSGLAITILAISLNNHINLLYFLSLFIFCLGILIAVLVSSRRTERKDANSPLNNVAYRILEGTTIFFIYTLVWIAFSIAIVSLFQIVPGVDKPNFIHITTSNITSWMTGFFSFAPAGIGVRELGFAELIGPTYAAQAVMVSAFERVLELIFEILFWLASFQIRRIKQP